MRELLDELSLKPREPTSPQLTPAQARELLHQPIARTGMAARPERQIAERHALLLRRAQPRFQHGPLGQAVQRWESGPFENPRQLESIGQAELSSHFPRRSDGSFG